MIIGLGNRDQKTISIRYLMISYLDTKHRSKISKHKKMPKITIAKILLKNKRNEAKLKRIAKIS